MKRIGIKLIFFSASLALCLACSKKPIVELHPDFVGSWRLKTETDIDILSIDSESKGYISSYDGMGNFQNYTEERTWITKDDFLYFGQLGTDAPDNNSIDEKFKIDSYPTLSTAEIISGIDTVYVGETYIVLDDEYYILME